jgi:nitrate/TMAO reductase-like tetraheme cytochrome c subunit
MKKFLQALRNFFLPPADAKTLTRILPLAAIAVLMLVFFVAANFAWEETNTPNFCGLTCHTMPPEHITYLNSVHTNVSCEDCHMGRDRLYVLIPRKIKYSWQTGSAMVLNTYEYPIVAKGMAPAREACENCHKPEVFSGDKLVEIHRFGSDEANTPTSSYLAVKIGGGTQREGLGYGIHWHVENVVEYFASDERDQVIPYIKVTTPEGVVTEFIDAESGFDTSTLKSGELKQMDCITCHNRVAHRMENPLDAMDDLLTRGLVSPSIPSIKLKGAQVLSGEYASDQAAMDAIGGLSEYYRQEYAAFYADNTALVDQAIREIQASWKRANFIDQKANWQTHPNNMAHKDSPGCFRCHDGKHVTAENVAIRLECNICHSIPVVSDPNDLTASLELSKGFEPESHKNPNWIALHREIFDESCQGCHTIADAGGVSNTSFCSNSACHGTNWQFAGFNAPSLREILGIETGSTSQEEMEPVVPEVGAATYANLVDLLKVRCGSCHGSTGMANLDIMDYNQLMAGGKNGPVILPGDAENSLFYKIQSISPDHFGMFSETELAVIKQWILDGAPEK